MGRADKQGWVMGKKREKGGLAEMKGAGKVI